MKHSELKEKEQREILRRLRRVANQAVQYVGSANYNHRETHALSVVSKCFAAAEEGRIDDIAWSKYPSE